MGSLEDSLKASFTFSYAHFWTEILPQSRQQMAGFKWDFEAVDGKIKSVKSEALFSPMLTNDSHKQGSGDGRDCEYHTSPDCSHKPLGII